MKNPFRRKKFMIIQPNQEFTITGWGLKIHKKRTKEPKDTK